jgi:hypothetical protein
VTEQSEVALSPQVGFCDPVWYIRRTRRVVDLPDIDTYERREEDEDAEPE